MPRKRAAEKEQRALIATQSGGGKLSRMVLKQSRKKADFSAGNVICIDIDDESENDDDGYIPWIV